jgi:hypothetical protein
MDPRYCEPADLYSYGMARGALTNAGRLAGSASAATSAVELDGHGFALGDVVSFRAEAGGSLPAPLQPVTSYYTIPVNDASFRVSATAAGAFIPFVTAGVRVIVIAPLPIEAAIRFASRIVDDMIPAALIPLAEPYPEVVRMTTAELAIWKLTTITGNAGGSIAQMIDFAQKRLARWATGVPIRGTNAPSPSGLALSASMGRNTARGWRRFGGIR